MNKKLVFQGFLGQEKPVTRKFAADWIRASRWFGCKAESIKVRSAHAIDITDGERTTRFILRVPQPN